MKKVNNTSVNTGNKNLDKLHRVFPQFIKENKIDFDALRKFFEDEEISAGEEKYGLNWAGKSNAFKLIRTPSVGTLTPQEKESKDWDKTENLFIEGDNLEVLKLLQKHYREKIKMIYIDPPYNTGKDFIYKDNYIENISDYYEKTGQSKNGIKMSTNPEFAGRYHSDWLTMMYPRLFLARNLLKEDGVIFISIDDNEIANLRLIMDEIFGEENLITQIVWKNRYNAAKEKHLAQIHEYILFYAKNKDSINPLYLPITQEYVEKYFKNKDSKSEIRGPYRLQPLEAGKSMDNRKNLVFSIPAPDGTTIKPKRQWKWEKKRVLEAIEKDEIEFIKTKEGWSISTKQYLKDNFGKEYGVKGFSIIEKIYNQEGTKEIEEFFGSVKFFPFPKPTILMKHLLNIGDINKEDIILDFFAGSGTTAHGVMDLNAEDGGNRKWIMVQLPEVTNEESEAYKAGYKTIAEIARERIKRAASTKATASQGGKKIDLGFKSFSLSKSNYRQWNILTDKDNEKKLKNQMKIFLEKPLVDGYNERSVVYEVLLKEGFNLNSKVTPFVIPAKAGIQSFQIWKVEDDSENLIVTFEKKVIKEQVESLKLTEEDTFVCLDSALDDTTKINIGRNLNVKVI